MRKLLHIAAGYGSALILSRYLLGHSILPYIAAGAFVLAFSAFFFKGTVRMRILLIALSFSIGTLWNWAYDELFVTKVSALSGHEKTVNALVLDYPELNDDYATALIRLSDDAFPRAKVRITSYDYDLSSLTPGDSINIPLKFYFPQDKNRTDNLFANGIYICAYVKGNLEVSSSQINKLILCQKSSNMTFKRSVIKCFPEDIASFTLALLTGDKSQLYDNVRLYSSLSTAGLAHIVAVSGMHLSFITGFCRMITGRRRRTAFICIPVIVAFMALVGFTPSVVRAGIMQIIVLLAPIFYREADSLTSLSFAFLILTVNPQTIASVSLQLSFAATAGIILFTPLIYKSLTGKLKIKSGIIAFFLRGLIGIFACSVGALIFTTPLCAVHFSYISLYGIVTNIICLWALTATFLLSLITALIGLAFPGIGAFLANMIAYLPRGVFAIAGFISDLPYSRLYTSNNYIVWWLVLVYILFIVTYIAKGDGKYRPVIPICCCIVSFCVITFFDSMRTHDQIAVTAVDVGQGQAITAVSDSSVVVIDCGSKTKGAYCAQLTAEELFSLGKQHIDLLILTHLHSDHANGASSLISLVDTRAIAMPDNAKQSEYYDEIVALAQDSGIEIYYITEDTSVSFGDVQYTLFAPLGKTDANENGIIVLGDYGEFEYLVTGDVNTGTENILCLTRELPDIELLVAGHHGSKYSCGDTLLKESSPDNVIISVGYNSYGHPSSETIVRIENAGAKLYRTDTQGSITITAGKNNG